MQWSHFSSPGSAFHVHSTSGLQLLHRVKSFLLRLLHSAIHERKLAQGVDKTSARISVWQVFLKMFPNIAKLGYIVNSLFQFFQTVYFKAKTSTIQYWVSVCIFCRNFHNLIFWIKADGEF